MEQLLTTQEVAELLQISEQTLHQWRYRKISPKGIRVGRHVRYRINDLEDWLDEQAQKQTT